MDTQTPHRMFYAMVLMGGSLALGCGGVATRGQQDEPSSGAGGGSGDGGGGGAGTGKATGGAGQGLGGAVSFGGSGMPQGGATQMPPALMCPLAQWDCSQSNQLGSCAVDGEGLRLPSDCACAPNRPLSVAECARQAAQLVCRWGSTTAEGVGLEAPVGFDCRCVPWTEQACTVACISAFGRNASCRAEAGEAVLCGCAVILIK